MARPLFLLFIFLSREMPAILPREEHFRGMQSGGSVPPSRRRPFFLKEGFALLNGRALNSEGIRRQVLFFPSFA